MIKIVTDNMPRRVIEHWHTVRLFGWVLSLRYPVARGGQWGFKVYRHHSKRRKPHA